MEAIGCCTKTLQGSVVPYRTPNSLENLPMFSVPRKYSFSGWAHLHLIRLGDSPPPPASVGRGHRDHQVPSLTIALIPSPPLPGTAVVCFPLKLSFEACGAENLCPVSFLFFNEHLRFSRRRILSQIPHLPLGVLEDTLALLEGIPRLCMKCSLPACLQKERGMSVV